MKPGQTKAPRPSTTSRPAAGLPTAAIRPLVPKEMESCTPPSPSHTVTLARVQPALRPRRAPGSSGFTRVPVPQPAAQDLAGIGTRQLVEEDERLGDLEA